jgi:hypothetical protein
MYFEVMVRLLNRSSQINLGQIPFLVYLRKHCSSIVLLKIQLFKMKLLRTWIVFCIIQSSLGGTYQL